MKQQGPALLSAQTRLEADFSALPGKFCVLEANSAAPFCEEDSSEGHSCLKFVPSRDAVKEHQAEENEES